MVSSGHVGELLGGTYFHPRPWLDFQKVAWFTGCGQVVFEAFASRVHARRPQVNVGTVGTVIPTVKMIARGGRLLLLPLAPPPAPQSWPVGWRVLSEDAEVRAERSPEVLKAKPLILC